MDRRLYTYALIKSLYDEGEDYLDAFWPFVISVVPTESFKDLKSIQEDVRRESDLEIPLHVLKTILTRAKRKGYLEQVRKQYRLTEKGGEYLNKFETPREVERRINALLDDLVKFFKNHGIELSIEETYDLLQSFINKNFDLLVGQFMGYDSNSISQYTKNLKDYERLIIEYIKIAENKKPLEFNTLENLFRGSIISAILYVRDEKELVEVRRKFRNLHIYLDTNFVFSALDLHAPEFSEPAKELFSMLKKFGFTLKIFDFTVNEMTRVIRGYIQEAYRYPYSIAVNTIYSTLKRKGWTKTEVMEFITNIEEILINKGISIERTGIDIDNYEPKDGKLMEIIDKWKPEKALSSRKHDIAAIERIKEIRGHPVRHIEDAKAIFLTSDIILSRLNFIDMGHKDNGTVSEVILDRLMACILWLKDPSTKLSIKSIISAYSRDLFIKKRVWDRFYETLKQLRQEGKINDKNISMLFYHNYIENVLRDIDENEIEKITPEFVLEEIEKAARMIEKHEARLIKEKEEEFIRKLKELEREKEQKERELLKEKETIEKLKRNLKEQAEKRANIESIICSFLILTLLVVILIFAYIWLKSIGMTEFLSMLLTFILGGSGVSIGIFNFYKYIKNKRSKHIYKQKLKNLGLN